MHSTGHLRLTNNHQHPAGTKTSTMRLFHAYRPEYASEIEEGSQDRIKYRDELEAGDVRKFQVRANKPESLLQVASPPPQPIPSSDTDASSRCYLLELSAELRNMIFELALGGCVIHVCYDEDDEILSRHICKRPSSEEADIQAIKDCELEKRHLSHITRHQHCFGSDPYDSDASDSDTTHATANQAPVVALLRTCRQIYNEAALIPFACNTFIFDERLDFGQFLCHLIPEQAAALQHLSMRFAPIDDIDGTNAKAAFLRQVVQDVIGGLTSLVCFAEFEGPKEFGKRKQMRRGAVSLLKELEVKRLTVRAYCFEGREEVIGRLESGLVSRKELVEWTEGVEAELKEKLIEGRGSVEELSDTAEGSEGAGDPVDAREISDRESEAGSKAGDTE